MSTWTKIDRGLGIGLLTGAIAFRNGFPSIVKLELWSQEWRMVLLSGGWIGYASGGMLAWTFIREGPYSSPTARFNWKYAVEIAMTRELRLANFGYLGHMWELFAMWAWVGVFLLASFHKVNISSYWAGLATFTGYSYGRTRKPAGREMGRPSRTDNDHNWRTGCKRDVLAARRILVWSAPGYPLVDLPVMGFYCCLGFGPIQRGNQRAMQAGIYRHRFNTSDLPGIHADHDHYPADPCHAGNIGLAGSFCDSGSWSVGWRVVYGTA